MASPPSPLTRHQSLIYQIDDAQRCILIRGPVEDLVALIDGLERAMQPSEPPTFRRYFSNEIAQLRRFEAGELEMEDLMAVELRAQYAFKRHLLRFQIDLKEDFGDQDFHVYLTYSLGSAHTDSFQDLIETFEAALGSPL